MMIRVNYLSMDPRKAINDQIKFQILYFSASVYCFSNAFNA